MRLGITCYPTVGGSGAVAAELGKQLARRGHDIHFISYRLPFRLEDFQQNICFHEVDVSSYPLFEYPPHDLALAVKMAEVAREHRLELFHVHYAIPHAIAGFLAQQMLGDKAPRMVTTLHGTDITIVGQDRSFFEITRFGIERSQGVTAVSEFLRRMTIQEFQVRNPIEVVPNFVDLDQYPLERPDRSAFAAPGQKVLLHVSNFRPVKRVLDVIRIFDRVHKEVDAVLLLVGEGPERSSAQALGRRLGIQDRLRFLGARQSIEEVVAMADVLLLPSELESFGLSALEAMAAGVPVVGSDAGGLPEVVRAHRDRLPASRGRRGRHGRPHPRDPEGRGAAARDGPGGAAAGGIALRRRSRGLPVRAGVREGAPVNGDFDLAAFFAHPDDAELVVGGTLAREAARGRRVAIVDLTRGESGSRGTPEGRAAEAAEAARVLGVAHRESLGLPDSRLVAVPEQRDLVVGALRRLRPQVVVTQHWEQRHPDHAATSRLVADAAFVAGLRNYRPDLGPAFRPRKIVYALPTTEGGEVDALVRRGRDHDLAPEACGHRRVQEPVHGRPRRDGFPALRSLSRERGAGRTSQRRADRRALRRGLRDPRAAGAWTTWWLLGARVIESGVHPRIRRSISRAPRGLVPGPPPGRAGGP